MSSALFAGRRLTSSARFAFAVLAALGFFAVGYGVWQHSGGEVTQAQSRGAKSQSVESPAASFTNSNPITITDAANATPYPPAIAVSGLTGTITNVTVTLNSFSHTFPDDVGIVLVAPTGAALLLQ